MISRWFFRLIVALLWLLGVALFAPDNEASAADEPTTVRAQQSGGVAPNLARAAILELSLDNAEAMLKGEQAPQLVIERARLALYRGDCDTAVELLDRPELEALPYHGQLFTVSLGCARATAATLVMRDKRGVVVRFQDDADSAMFPVIVDAALAARDMLKRELGTGLPDPIFIDLVRDQLSLSAHTGLPEAAAQTTGTVAVAKFGRVIMISPRAAPFGYSWLDTLSHELTHLVLSRATRERAPLWLQEGVAKRQETRWRERHRFDGIPSSDAIALDGIKRGLGLPLDGLGPSIAMLPSPEQAGVAFAEVASFIDFWVGQNGAPALPKLLAAIRDMPPGGRASDAIAEVSKLTLAEWDKRWRSALPARAAAAESQWLPSQRTRHGSETAQRRRLGQLLLKRGHHHAAQHQLQRAHSLDPEEASIRCLYADALVGVGEQVAAAALFEEPAEVLFPSARWWSLHAFFEMDAALPSARAEAIANHPFSPPVSCGELPPGEWPSQPFMKQLCELARLTHE